MTDCRSLWIAQQQGTHPFPRLRNEQESRSRYLLVGTALAAGHPLITKESDLYLFCFLSGLILGILASWQLSGFLFILF